MRAAKLIFPEIEIQQPEPVTLGRRERDGLHLVHDGGTLHLDPADSEAVISMIKRFYAEKPPADETVANPLSKEKPDCSICLMKGAVGTYQCKKTCAFMMCVFCYHEWKHDPSHKCPGCRGEL